MKLFLIFLFISITVHFTNAIQCYECYDKERPKSCETTKQTTREDPQKAACLTAFFPNGTIGMEEILLT
jgi:hypothetical protein